MPASITEYVSITVNVQGANPNILDFGSVMGAFAHSVNTNRLNGPYNDLTEATAAGFTQAAVPEIYNWLQTVFAQPNGGRPIYVGRRVGAESWTLALDAIEAVDPDAFYHFTIESRASADILLAAAWAEARNNDSLKRYVAQSNDASFLAGAGPTYTATFGGTATDGLYRLQFTGFGLTAPVNADVTRTGGSPATNTDLATAMASFITGLISTSLAGKVVSATSAAAVVTIIMANGIGPGVITPTAPSPGTLVVALTDGGSIATQLNAFGYKRTDLLYHASSTGANGYLDALYADVAGGFRLDQPAGVGAMAYKSGAGVTFDALTAAQATAIRAASANYYGRKRGLSFFWPGQSVFGPPYFHDITTTVDWFVRRSQEAFLALQVGTPTKIAYSQNGIDRVAGAVQKVLDNGVVFGHFLGDPGFEPFVESAKIATVSSADKQARALQLTSKANRATFEGAIQKLTLSINMLF